MIIRGGRVVLVPPPDTVDVTASIAGYRLAAPEHGPLRREHYPPAALDRLVGPVPTYGNPGAVETPLQFHRSAHQTCRVHETRWATGGCWMCPDEVSP